MIFKYRKTIANYAAACCRDESSSIHARTMARGRTHYTSRLISLCGFIYRKSPVMSLPDWGNSSLVGEFCSGLEITQGVYEQPGHTLSICCLGEDNHKTLHKHGSKMLFSVYRSFCIFHNSCLTFNS
jgi:hypothetical protein